MSKNERILVIDDDEDFLNWIVFGLNNAGYEVITSTTAKDGLKLLEEKKDEILLVIIDIALPDKNGFELIKNVKLKYSYIPIIGISGVYKSQDVIYKGYELGADEFLVKPFSYEFLMVKIKNILRYFNKL